MIEYSALFANVRELEKKTNTQTTFFQPTIICQYHQAVSLLTAPPASAFPKLKSLKGKQTYSDMQIDISYSNEAHDDPDLLITAPAFYGFVASTGSPRLFQCVQYSLRTKKPVPQHHSLCDLTGVYCDASALHKSLLLEFRAITRANNKISILRVLERLTKIKFFPPMCMFVDQRHFGSVARYTTFVREHPSGYLKAVGIGGGVRLQLHCTQDIAKDTEMSLLLDDYFCMKRNSELYNYMLCFIQGIRELQQLEITRPWEKIMQKISPKDENYQLALTSSRAAFIVSFSLSKFA